VAAALHSNAFRTPFYRTSVNLLIRDKTRGIAFARLRQLPQPDRVLGAALTEDSKWIAQSSIRWVTCTTCIPSSVGFDQGKQCERGVPA